MSKNAFMATIIITVFLISIVAGMQGVKANPLPIGAPSPPLINIESPLNSTYYQNDIQLVFTVYNASLYIPMYFHIANASYVLDGKQSYLNGSFPTNQEQFYSYMTGLSDGEHTLTVIVGEEGLYESNIASGLFPYTEASSQTVTFTVTKDLETNPSPSPSLSPNPSQQPISFPLGLTVYSPVNSTYSSNPVHCNVTFACYFGVGCSLNYSIDGVFQDGLPTGNPNVVEFADKYVLSSSFDLPQLSNGIHQITFGIEVKQTLYGGATTLPSDIPFQPTYPNSSSYVASWLDTVYFTLNQNHTTAITELPTFSPSPSPSPTPTVSTIMTPSPSPTQQPTIEPSATPDNTKENFTPILIIAALVVVILAVAAGALFYFKKKKG